MEPDAIQSAEGEQTHSGCFITERGERRARELRCAVGGGPAGRCGMVRGSRGRLHGSPRHVSLAEGRRAGGAGDRDARTATSFGWWCCCWEGIGGGAFRGHSNHKRKALETARGLAPKTSSVHVPIPDCSYFHPAWRERLTEAQEASLRFSTNSSR